jgi:NAD(P)-dependent dehydrogenase (short-subunit alcohol dehydrogenase family)
MRTALVTGAARGIGRATVLGLAERGWSVVAGVRDVEAAGFDHPAVSVVRLDVTDADSVRSGVDAAQQHAGGALDAVVSNAGYALLGAVEDVGMDDVRAVFETNTFGALAVVQAALPAMREAGGGAIVFVSTIGASLPTPLVGAYRASKAALNSFADVLSLEGRPFGIRVGRVEPGMVATEFSKATRRSGSITDPEGPYAALGAALFAGMGAWRARFESTADEVAEEIIRLVEDPAAEQVVLVGDDAKQLHGSSEDDIIAFLGAEWPRRP